MIDIASCLAAINIVIAPVQMLSAACFEGPPAASIVAAWPEAWPNSPKAWIEAQMGPRRLHVAAQSAPAWPPHPEAIRSVANATKSVADATQQQPQECQLAAARHEGRQSAEPRGRGAAASHESEDNVVTLPEPLAAEEAWRPRLWFAFYPADYDRDTPDLTIEQHGVYFRLLSATWNCLGCALPNDKNYIRSVLPRTMHGHAYNRLVPPILKRFFQLGPDNKYRQKRLSAEWEKAREKSVKGRQSVGKRWAKVPRKKGNTNENKGAPHRNVILNTYTDTKKERAARCASPPETAARAPSEPTGKPNGDWVDYDTPQWDAWRAHYTAAGRKLPNPVRNGLQYGRYFPPKS